MRKVICAPEGLIPNELDNTVKYFCTYSYPHREGVGYIAPSLPRDLVRDGITPSTSIWDFATIALSVVAADNSISRVGSEDGWTRQIELNVYLYNLDVWEPVKEDLEKTLRFLTGDFWSLVFLPGGISPPEPNEEATEHDTDCVCLLSGGVDSLVGAIDLVQEGRKPMLVSQIVRGNAYAQRFFAQRICKDLPHFQWSHKLHRPDGEIEDSNRSRSIVFMAYAALAASSLQCASSEIHMPENGFISLNIPLNPGRIGSFSTKTTHPKYTDGIQSLWDSVGMDARLISRYRFKTKGEMLRECQNTDLLVELLPNSTSCGKFGRKQKHCGQCVPCMVRRAAFLHSEIEDTTTKGYRFEDLLRNGVFKGRDDVAAMATACYTCQHYGIDALIKSSLSFAQSDQKTAYREVVRRGFEEIAVFLSAQGVL